MIPCTVDASFEHRPVMNWLAFAGLILGFILKVKLPESYTEALVLRGWSFGGFFGHIWVHANIAQLIAVLLFIWIFGNGVCGKIGNKVYVLVFLLLGLSGGMIHLLISDNPAMGASVVLSGLVGMYLMFLPENSINCFFLLPRPVMLEVSSYFIIFMWFFIDVFRAAIGVACPTYYAHVWGFGAGFGLAALMLKKKWVTTERDEKSLLQLLSRKQEEPEAKEEVKGKDNNKGKKDKVDEKGRFVISKEEVTTKQGAGTEAPVTNEFIHFSCSCGAKIRVRKEYAGKTGRCKHCHKPVQVPGSAESSRLEQ
ncbi:MAG: rhomboid family intramembrane serine protease [Planctomycetota bacterium]|jgi:membrane associated rhomboid family serine protease